MGLFGRNQKQAQEPESIEGEGTHGSVDDDQEQTSTQAGTPSSERRHTGPWDLGDDYPDVPRVDLGALRLPQVEGLRIQVQADPGSGVVSQLSLVSEDSAVQIQPYAAPRSAGMWDDIRGQLKSSINSAGGLVEEVSGNYGIELHAQVTNAEGKQQPARFCGIEGPRWFVRLVFLGRAARDNAAAATMEQAIADIVVVRGDEAMPMGKALDIRVPVGQQGESAPLAENAEKTPQRPPITLPDRGPEITETR